jgi:hypothetical protein
LSAYTVKNVIVFPGKIANLFFTVYVVNERWAPGTDILALNNERQLYTALLTSQNKKVFFKDADDNVFKSYITKPLQILF